MIERASQIHEDSLELNGDGNGDGNLDGGGEHDEHMIPDDTRRMRLAQVMKLLKAQYVYSIFHSNMLRIPTNNATQD